MSANTRAEFIRLGFVAAIVGILLTTPLLGIESAATITEDLFISDTANDQVYVLRTRWKGKKAATVNLRGIVKKGISRPTDMAVASDVALIIDRGRQIRIVDTATLKVIGKVKTGKNTRSVAITPDGTIAVAAQGKKNLRIIDVAKGKVVKTVKGGKVPWRVRLDDRGELGIVTNVGDNSVSILDIDVLAGRSTAPLTARAAGVETIKKGVCNLSGGVDVARFPPFGTFAEWSCGVSPQKVADPTSAAAADAPGQTLRISDVGFGVSDLVIPGTTSTNSLFYNPLCPGVGRASTEGGSDDGSSGDEDDEETDSRRIGRAAPRRAFNYNFITSKKTILGPGRLVNPFALVNGNRVTLYHPQGVTVAKTKVFAGPGDAEIFAVESTLQGIPSVCSR